MFDDVTSITTWPKAIVACVCAICLASLWMGRWPWESKDDDE